MLKIAKLSGISACFRAFCLAVILGGGAAAQTSAGDQTAKIGVLAFRGAGPAEAQWQPLARYLSDAVDGWRFEIVPVTLVSAPGEIRAGSLDFLITNPGHYVTLAEQFGLGALATRERRVGDEAKGLMRYGTVIFTRSDSGIVALDDLKGKRVAAVSPEAFGGFQLAWQEFTDRGIDPFSDIETIRFMGFPQDAIVTAVLNGEVEAGIVRSGLLEGLASEGRISLPDFVVLHNNSQPGYPYMVTGRLYPEWPFTALPGIDKSLREAVTLALLDTQKPQVAGAFALQDLWSAPLSYEDVRQLTSAYHDAGTEPVETENLIKDPYFFIFLIVVGGTILFLVRSTPQIAWRSRKPVKSAVLPETEEERELACFKERFDNLTKREREILSMICNGQQTREIAETLGISPKTVEYHRANLLQKTDAGTTARLVQLATRFGFDLGFSPGHSTK